MAPCGAQDLQEHHLIIILCAVGATMTIVVAVLALVAYPTVSEALWAARRVQLASRAAWQVNHVHAAQALTVRRLLELPGSELRRTFLKLLRRCVRAHGTHWIGLAAALTSARA